MRKPSSPPLKKNFLTKMFFKAGLWILFLAVINSILFLALRIGNGISVSWFSNILNLTYFLYGVSLLLLILGVMAFLTINFRAIIKTRKRYIFLILALIALFLVLYNTTKCDSYYGPLKVQNECTNLTENECFENPSCRGVYGPSSCGCNVCTADIGYNWCVKMTEEEIQKAEINKLACERTNGSWSYETYTKPGRCSCDYFAYGEGCFAMESDCQMFGGVIYEKGELECNDFLREKDPYTCRERDGFNIFEECICPDGIPWDYRSRCREDSREVEEINTKPENTNIPKGYQAKIISLNCEGISPSSKSEMLELVWRRTDNSCASCLACGDDFKCGCTIGEAYVSDEFSIAEYVSACGLGNFTIKKDNESIFECEDMSFEVYYD